MADNTGITWTDSTWNPLTGCTRVSEGCVNCYAERLSARMATNPIMDRYMGVASFENKKPRWTGALEFHPKAMDLPLRWPDPRKVFTGSMSDLFHENVKEEWLVKILAVMAIAGQRGARSHTFQLLTKRPERMRSLIGQEWFARRVREAALEATTWLPLNKRGVRIGVKAECEKIASSEHWQWPLSNVWLGISAENQERLDERVPSLLLTPAVVHFVSYEPALGPVKLSRLHQRCPTHDFAGGFCCSPCPDLHSIDWLIAGGESGPCHRSAELEWFEAAHNQCLEYGVPFFMKQDSGPKPGKQGRISDRLWTVKEFPIGEVIE